MTDIHTIARGLWKTIDDNSPAILTAISVTGVISTAVLASKASFQAAADIEYEEHKDAHVGYQKLPLKGRALLVWQLYIPAMAVGAASIACIIGANTVSSRRAAALATAYSLTERAFTEHKEKVVELVGQGKATKIRDSIAEDHLKNNPPPSNEILILGDGESLCYDSLTGRYFKSDMETLRRAQNTINQQIINEGHGSQNDFYSEIGLGRVVDGDNIGWNTGALIDLQFSSILQEGTGKPAIHIGYRDLPISKYYKIH